MSTDEKIPGTHTAFAFRLYFNYPKRCLIATLDDEVITVCGNHFPFARVSHAEFDHSRFPNY
jgi:hypothetical protein